MQKLIQILFISFSLAATSSDIYDNSWALIIGIDKYQNVQKLNYAVDDAEDVKDLLIDQFGFPQNNITLLKNEEATKQNILKSFRDITRNAKKNDRVLIFFAGHGETYNLPEGGEIGYLLPYDSDSDDLYYTSIPMNEFKTLSTMSESKHLLFLIDACYGGLASIGTRGLNVKTPNYIEKISQNKARQIITAGGRGEQVIEKSEWGHSAFTLHLNRGLKDGNADMNADGYITAAELGIYLNEKVTIDSENQQTPQYGRMTSQEGEFVFVYSEHTIINQNVGNTSTDAKLDLLLSKIEQLELQSKSSENLTASSEEPLLEISQMEKDSINANNHIEKSKPKRKFIVRIVFLAWFVVWVYWGLMPPP